MDNPMTMAAHAVANSNDRRQPKRSSASWAPPCDRPWSAANKLISKPTTTAHKSIVVTPTKAKTPNTTNRQTTLTSYPLPPPPAPPPWPNRSGKMPTDIEIARDDEMLSDEEEHCPRTGNQCGILASDNDEENTDAEDERSQEPRMDTTSEDVPIGMDEDNNRKRPVECETETTKHTHQPTLFEGVEDAPDRELEPIVSDSVISTKSRTADYNPTELLKHLGGTPDNIKWAQTAFEDARQIEDALWTILTFAIKVQNPTLKTVSDEELLKIYKQKGLSPQDWMLFFIKLLRPQQYDESVIWASADGFQTLGMSVSIMWRLAHTPPTTLGVTIKKELAKATFVSSAWYGAKMVLGSWFVAKDTKRRKKQQTLKESLARAEAEKTQKKRNQKPPTSTQAEYTKEKMKSAFTGPPPSNDSKKKKSFVPNDKRAEKHYDSEEEDLPDANADTRDPSTVKDPTQAPDESTSPSETNAGDEATKTNTSTQSKLPATAKSKCTADQSQAKRTNREVRLNIMVKTAPKQNMNASQIVHLKIKEMFTAIKQDDPRAILLPWRRQDNTKLPAICSIAAFPASFGDARMYVKSARCKLNSNNWVKICMAMDIEPKDVTTHPESNMDAWYEENDMKAYLCPIQQSDNTRRCGTFLYSGAFIDTDALTTAILEELQQKRSNIQWKIALKAKKHNEITAPTGRTSFLMAPNTPVSVEADADQAKEVNHYLYRRFNNLTDTRPRPLFSNLRYLSDASMINAGTGGERRRADMMAKHSAVTSNLLPIESDDIKDLDKQVDIVCPLGIEATYTTTLRQILMDMTFPLRPQPNARKMKLFHSVDMIRSYQGGIKTVCTAFRDRIQVASGIVNILHSYVTYFYGVSAANKWCQSIPGNEATLTLDQDGNWTGEWTTENDDMNDNLFSEDMGFNIDNIALVEHDNNRRAVFTTDDASMRSFHFGGSVQSTNSVDDAVQDTEVTEQPGSATEAPAHAVAPDATAAALAIGLGEGGHHT